MKRTMLLIGLVVVGLMAGAAQANMLVNSGFEAGAFGANDTPDYWAHFYTSYAPNHTWVSDVGGAHTGSKYMKMNNWTTGTWSSNGWLGQNVLGVKEGKDYSFSVWAKNDGEGQANLAEVNCEWRDSLDNWISSISVYVVVTDANWVEIDFGAFRAPERAAAVTVWLVTPVDNVENAICYDDVSMLGPDPNITAGFDMISWEGETLSLTGTTSLDGYSTITWSAEPDYGADITDGETLTPTVDVHCIIPSGPAATIANHSFENDLDDWEIVGGDAGTWNGAIADANGLTVYITPTDGRQCAWVYGGDGAGVLSQVLVNTLAANTDYTLNVDVVNDGYYEEDVAYRVMLWAGGALLAQDNDTQHALDTYGVWET